ncbi:MAG TPA: CoA-transferase [Actinomycetota bacterium]|nr:CoA-transferase [Actinomycetota bacterium]
MDDPAARAALVARGPDKVATLASAVKDHVRPGDHIHFTSGLSRPQASCMQLLRTFAGTSPGFTLSCMSLAGPYVLLVSEGLVADVICAFHGDTLPTPGPNPLLQRTHAEGAFTLSCWSILSFTQRLLAGALGLPWMPTRSLAGSSMQANAEVLELDGTLAVRALVPDVAFVHAVAADRYGNVLLGAPFGDLCLGAWGARRGAIVTVEKVVEPEVVAAHPVHMRLPGNRVLAVAEVPFGAHPGPLFAEGLRDLVEPYAEDPDFWTGFRRACRDPGEMADWRSQWVDTTHDGYLARLGQERLELLRDRAAPQEPSPRPGPLRAGAAAPREAAPAAAGPAPADDPAPTEAEMAVVAGARALAARVRKLGLRTVLAGVGLSNLSAWLARADLAAQGTPLDLMVELGLYDYLPPLGDPLLVSNRTAATATGLGSVLDILGLALSATASAGILGAGQVDRRGNINSSVTADGRLLVGSGGSNDVASICRDVVVVCVQSKDRFVHEVPYVTAPGRPVSVVATQAGLYERVDGELVLSAVFGDLADGVARARDECGWALRVAGEVRILDDPLAHEVALIRAYDPSGWYVGRPSRR